MQPRTVTPLLYGELAPWWPLMSAPADYQDAAQFYQKVLVESCSQPPATMLELGSGGGNNASHLKHNFQLTLVDVAPGMLKVSKQLNPECAHICGDMRSVRLAREFDCVFVHDAVGYMTTQSDLRRAMQTAFVHCRPGGAVLMAPDHTRENFRPSTRHGGHDGHGRALRYLEWTWDPDPDDETYVVDCAYLLRDEDNSVRVLKDRHEEGLFPRARWLGLMTDVGFAPSTVGFEHSEMSGVQLEVFVGKKPETGSNA